MRRSMPTSPESYFDSFHKTPQGEFKNSYYNPFHVKPRKRTSKEQLEVLEKTFETNMKPDAALRKSLAAKLGMTPRSVQVWFQNKRAKVKNEKATKKEKQKAKEVHISQSLYVENEAEKPEDAEEKTKEDYECFLMNYSGFTQEYEYGLRSRQYLEEIPSFKEEDLRSLDKLILGEENTSRRSGKEGRSEEENDSDSSKAFCNFYVMASSLQFDPGNYLN